jgi:hypothetical protein
MARLGIIYIDGDGAQKERSFGAYVPRPNFITYGFRAEGVADGTMVNVHRDSIKHLPLMSFSSFSFASRGTCRLPLVSVGSLAPMEADISF